MSTAASFYQVYAEHARILRTWLVAYGIGAPVLLLTNERIATSIGESGLARRIALCFLVGAGLQVVLSALNKAIMWQLYIGESDARAKARLWYKLADWLSERFGIDLFCDVAAISLFGYATYVSFMVVVK